jgi:hypothetical protein
MTPGLTQSLIEMSTRNIGDGKARSARKADQPHRHLQATFLDSVGSSIFHNSIVLHGLLLVTLLHCSILFQCVMYFFCLRAALVVVQSPSPCFK